MAKTATFSDILNKPASEVERPKPLPAGTYLCVVKGLPRFDKSSKKQTEFVEFNLSPMQAGEDVDQEDLAAMLLNKDGTSKVLNELTIRATYYLTDNSLYRLKDFLTHCGLDVESDASLRQLVDAAPGCQVTAFVKHQASDDGQSVYAQLGGTAVAE